MLSTAYRWCCFGAAMAVGALILSAGTESMALGMAAYLLCFIFFPAVIALRLIGGA